MNSALECEIEDLDGNGNDVPPPPLVNPTIHLEDNGPKTEDDIDTVEGTKEGTEDDIDAAEGTKGVSL
jgi:hypothetical protein